MLGIQFEFEVNDMVSGALEGIKAQFDQAFDNEKTLAKFNAGLGQSVEVTQRMGDIAKEVWQTGVGESLEDVTGAISEVGSQMLNLGTSSPEEIRKITTGALDLASVMGVDVPEVTRAAGQLMKNGLAVDAQQAFDIIAMGAQNGANRSGDLLDVFAEYGPAFSAIGVDGPTALGMMNAALDAGVYNADKAADAINEFGVRAIDGSTGSQEAFAALGLSADEMAAKIAAGGPTATQATSTIIRALGAMTDPVAQETAGVALFGSMWEDAGAKAILSMDPAKASTQNLAGATQKMGDTLRDTATAKVDTMKRSIDGWVQSMITTKGPIGDIMAFASTFGPQAVSLAGSIGMVALALKGTGLAAWGATAAMGALSIAASPLALIAAAIVSIITLVGTAIREIDHLKSNWNSLMSGNIAGATSLRSPGAMFGGGGGFSIWGHAAGGVVTRPHLAMVGEGGEPEMILPLSKVGDMLAAAGGGGGGGITVNVPGGFVGSADELAMKIRDILVDGKRRGVIESEF